jgi:hypothetical protein
MIVLPFIKDATNICHCSFAEISRWIDVKPRFNHKKFMMIKNASNKNSNEWQKYPVNPTEFPFALIFSNQNLSHPPHRNDLCPTQRSQALTLGPSQPLTDLRSDLRQGKNCMQVSGEAIVMFHSHLWQIPARPRRLYHSIKSRKPSSTIVLVRELSVLCTKTQNSPTRNSVLTKSLISRPGHVPNSGSTFPLDRSCVPSIAHIVGFAQPWQMDSISQNLAVAISRFVRNPTQISYAGSRGKQKKVLQQYAQGSRIIAAKSVSLKPRVDGWTRSSCLILRNSPKG